MGTGVGTITLPPRSNDELTVIMPQRCPSASTTVHRGPGDMDWKLADQMIFERIAERELLGDREE